ncbi:DNA-processing protein DprA [Rhodalgimonas zhirmunskyi]|uniref:DNA-processing protein DprA n=1 Tax=Rhodalgimonas zhirmunskyi TaxID=2964767 RepID=A0AAJ1X3Y5_9RHOB|nr:DNA-processing protein DprA [Rhodoalgimonas zhirmunskyi]MDQ2093758.1 DNA-processing protein DprA [Rhodoalgimonas zhirmunskyi]
MPEELPSSTPPPLPPTTEDDRVSWLRLLRSRRVGTSTFYRLIAEHGSARAALAALPEVAKAAGMKDYFPCSEERALGEYRAGMKIGARLVCKGEDAYPAALCDLSDAPPFLWMKGDVSVLQRPLIAMVGARNASSLGTRMARALAVDLAKRGYVIVSGLARGVDTAAHKATVETGTVAVMAGGVDVIYPSENTVLAQEIEAHGLRISEQPIGLVPQARHFPRRNRLISGLARGVIVVEAAAKSGSLITARNALDQGREVMAVPGHPFDARASGSNMLIRDGAHLVRGVEDVLEALGPFAGIVGDQSAQGERVQGDLPLEPPANAAVAEQHATGSGDAAARNGLITRAVEAVTQRRGRTPTTPDAVVDVPAQTPEKRGLRETAQLHQMILDRLGPSPLAEDQLIRDLAHPANRVAPVLLDMELDGLIQRQPGGLLSREDKTG